MEKCTLTRFIDINYSFWVPTIWFFQDEWPSHHGMTRPHSANGGDGLQEWRVAALNKYSRTADKGCLSSLGVGQGANTSWSLKLTM
jgi:hypothetical protein